MQLPSALRSLLSPETPPSQRRIGPFHLLRQLGRGGFAPVWLAEERYAGQPLRWAALKLFALSAGETEIGQGILEEARRLCQVEHPNVVRFYTLTVDEARGVAGLAMEYIDGASLDQTLGDRGKLTLDEALAAGAAVASALAAVHGAGLVHRDVKPANVLQAGGLYKLIDFGIAEVRADGKRRGPKASAPPRVVLDDLPLELTGTKLFELPRGSLRVLEGGPGEQALWAAGTVGYMDPCCLRDGEPASAASDLYGLGVLLFECLSGKLPAATEGALRGAILSGNEAPPSLRSLTPGAPEPLVALVEALLSPDRARRPGSAEHVLIELEKIQRGLRGRPVALPAEGPFRGLGRYEQADRDVYFGRSTEVAASLDRLRTRGLVALIGLSGAGKSSLARAGVLPAVVDGALGGWPRAWSGVVTSPGADPRRALAVALEGIGVSLGDASPEQAIEALAAHATGQQQGVLLLVDQLEELATLSDPPSRRWMVAFLRLVGEQPRPGLRALVTLRQDLLASLLDPALELGSLRDLLLRGTVFVLPLIDAAWGEVLDEALGRYGCALSPPDLRDEILRELRGAPSAMPLVQFALAELWERRDRERNLIHRDAFRALGGIGGALERHAEATILSLRRLDGGEEAAREVLLALTTPQGTRAARSPEHLAALAPAAPAILDALRQARLVVDDSGGVTLAHEALLDQWKRLRSWVEASRSERQQIEALEQAAAAWRAAGRDDTLLLRKGRLAQGEATASQVGPRLSPDARAFVDASRSHERRGRRQRAAAIATVASLFAGLVALYLDDVRAKSREIERQNAVIAASLKAAEERRNEAVANLALANQRTGELDEAKRHEEAERQRYERELRDLEQRIDRASSRAQLDQIRREIQKKRGTLAPASGLPLSGSFRPGLEGEPPP